MAGAIASVAFPFTNVKTMDVLFAFEVPLPSLYTLSLLVTLDSRRAIRRSAAVATPRLVSGIALASGLTTYADPTPSHLHHSTASLNPKFLSKSKPKSKSPPGANPVGLFPHSATAPAPGFNPYATAIAASRRPPKPVPIMGLPMVDIDGAIERGWERLRYPRGRPVTKDGLGGGIRIETLVEEHDDFEVEGGGGGGQGNRRRQQGMGPGGGLGVRRDSLRRIAVAGAGARRETSPLGMRGPVRAEDQLTTGGEDDADAT